LLKNKSTLSKIPVPKERQCIPILLFPKPEAPRKSQTTMRMIQVEAATLTNGLE
jgi:hypothetical protein